MANNKKESFSAQFETKHKEGKIKVLPNVYFPLGKYETVDGEPPSLSSYLTKIETTGAQAVAMPNATREGTLKYLYMTVHAGDYVLSGSFHSGVSTLTFGGANAQVQLVWSQGAWTIVMNFGATEA